MQQAENHPEDLKEESADWIRPAAILASVCGNSSTQIQTGLRTIQLHQQISIPATSTIRRWIKEWNTEQKLQGPGKGGCHLASSLRVSEEEKIAAISLQTSDPFMKEKDIAHEIDLRRENLREQNPEYASLPQPPPVSSSTVSPVLPNA